MKTRLDPTMLSKEKKANFLWSKWRGFMHLFGGFTVLKRMRIRKALMVTSCQGSCKDKVFIEHTATNDKYVCKV